MAFDYVKFRRGNAIAFSALNPKDPNTLYFVYENVDAKKGLLYLGDKLIGGGTFSELIGVDVENAQPGDILIYTNIGDDEHPEWVWKASDPSEQIAVPEGYEPPIGGVLEEGDTLAEALAKLDAAIGIPDLNTWRAIRANGVDFLSNSIDSGAINFAAGEGIILNAENGTITIAFDQEALEALIEEILGDILHPYDGSDPGLVPEAPELEHGEALSDYVLGGDGKWININTLGVYWEDIGTVIMPDVVGMSLPDGEAKLHNLGFSSITSMKVGLNPGLNPMQYKTGRHIMSQSPEADTEVDIETPITLGYYQYDTTSDPNM